MRTVEQLARDPKAGLALLCMHAWLRQQSDVSETAFDLLWVLARGPQSDEQAINTLHMIAAGDEQAGLILWGLRMSFALERAEALGKAVGNPFELSEELCDRILAQMREIQRKGGAR